MKDILQDLERWHRQKETIGLATVIRTWGSAPRGVGAKLAFTLDGKISGSVSGGCVEGAVIEAGLLTLDQNAPQLLHFGVADETAWDVGLACGGTIDIFVEKLDPISLQFLVDLYAADDPFAASTVIKGPTLLVGKKMIVQRDGRLFGEIDPAVDDLVAAKSRSQMEAGRSSVYRLEDPDRFADPIDLFIEVEQQAPRLIIIGGVHIAIALSAFAKVLGFQTILVDPRRAFATVERFPEVDRLIQKWPDKAFEDITITAETAIASLTHDPKIDDPVLQLALNSPAFYVGALGSRKTHSKRRQRLASSGITEERLDKIHGPIGLDIGAATPEEIALSIMAEIIRARQLD